MSLLSKLLEAAQLQEAKTADTICNDAAAIQSLASGAVAKLKADNKEFRDLPMASVTQQVRSFVDGALIDKGVRLNKAGLESVVRCVLQDFQTRGKEHGITEAKEPPAAKKTAKPSKSSKQKLAEDDMADPDDATATTQLSKSLEQEPGEDDEDEDVKIAEKAVKEAKPKRKPSMKQSVKESYDALPKEVVFAISVVESKSAITARRDIKAAFPNLTAEQLSHVGVVWRAERE